MTEEFNFLPEDYREPSTEKYTKIEDGDNTIRILTPAIYGWEYWTSGIDDEGKEVRTCHRVPLNTAIPESELGTNKWGKVDYPKVFWAFAIYSWDKDAIQIFQTTTKAIREGIQNLMSKPLWGSDLRKYDVVITRTGKEKETKYSITANPKQDLPQEIWDKLEAKQINLSKIFENENPFGAEETEDRNDDSAREEIDIDDVDKMMNKSA